MIIVLLLYTNASGYRCCLKNLLMKYKLPMFSFPYVQEIIKNKLVASYPPCKRLMNKDKNKINIKKYKKNKNKIK